jgi:hypothetical protein
MSCDGFDGGRLTYLGGGMTCLGGRAIIWVVFGWYLGGGLKMGKILR